VVVPKGIEKFERTVIEASKQCGRNRLMAIDAVQAWASFVGRADLPADRVLLHTGDAGLLGPMTGPRVVAVGPEGGFTDDELACGWRRARLGPRVLRVETAAIAAACQ
jgi:16S rRNA (uracil1498-N3)-methyltransferase